MKVPELVVPWPEGFLDWPLDRKHAWVDRATVTPCELLQDHDAVVQSFRWLSHLASLDLFDEQTLSVFGGPYDEVTTRKLADWPWVAQAWAWGAGLPTYSYADHERRAMVARIVPATWILWDKNAGHFRIERINFDYYDANHKRPCRPTKLVATVGPDGPVVHERITEEQRLQWTAASSGRDIELLRVVQTEGEPFRSHPDWVHLEDLP